MTVLVQAGGEKEFVFDPQGTIAEEGNMSALTSITGGWQFDLTTGASGEDGDTGRVYAEFVHTPSGTTYSASFHIIKVGSTP